MFNSLVGLLNEHSVQFTENNIESLVSTLTKSLCDLLWHITCHHKYYSDRGKEIPDIFKPFADLNDYVAKKKSRPRLSAKELDAMIDKLSGNITNPYTCKQRFNNFHSRVTTLLQSTKGIVSHMRTNSEYTQSKHKESTPQSNPQNDSIIKVIDKVEMVDQRYSDLSKTVAVLDDYESIHLAEYEPADRYKRRHWIDALKLSHALCMYRMPYGGNFGTMTFKKKSQQNLKTEMKRNKRKLS